MSSMVYIILAVVAVLGIGALVWFIKARKDKKIPEDKLSAPLPEEDEPDVVLVKTQEPKPAKPAPAPKPEPPKPAPPKPEPPKPEPPKPAPPKPEPPKPEIKPEITFDADDMAIDDSPMDETMEVQLEREGLEDIPDDAVEVVLDAGEDEEPASVVEPEKAKAAPPEKKAATPAPVQAANPGKGAEAAKKTGGDDQEKFAEEVDNELDALFGDDK